MKNARFVVYDGLYVNPIITNTDPQKNFVSNVMNFILSLEYDFVENPIKRRNFYQTLTDAKENPHNFDLVMNLCLVLKDKNQPSHIVYAASSVLMVCVKYTKYKKDLDTLKKNISEALVYAILRSEEQRKFHFQIVEDYANNPLFDRTIIDDIMRGYAKKEGYSKKFYLCILEYMDHFNLYSDKELIGELVFKIKNRI